MKRNRAMPPSIDATKSTTEPEPVTSEASAGPGQRPALASLVTGSGSIVLFVASMLGGMALFRLTSNLTAKESR